MSIKYTKIHSDYYPDGTRLIEKYINKEHAVEIIVERAMFTSDRVIGYGLNIDGKEIDGYQTLREAKGRAERELFRPA